jgi:hypothetical protein
MNQSETLRQHQAVCDELYQCVLDENRHLRQHMTAPDAAQVARKRSLLTRLDGALDAMREIPAETARDSRIAAQIENGRARILQILQLERENEQLLLRCSTTGTRQKPPAASAAGMLQKIYARNS